MTAVLAAAAILAIHWSGATQSPAVLPALPWLLPFLLLLYLGRRTPSLAAVPPVDGPPLSIIIPARNEAPIIEDMVRSVLASRYPRLEVLVVDDRSTDDTAARVAALAARDPRLRLVPGRELPPGWYGKPWACVQGYRAATGELLLFTDADTTHQPDLHGRAVAALLSRGADLLTIASRQRCVTWGERLVMPQVWLLLGVRYHPRIVNRARRARDVIANGQFILVPRASYERAGTHEAVKGEVAEDLALAQTFWRHGMRLHFAFAEHLMETRMYRGLRHLIEGWSKNIYLGGRRSFPDEPWLRALSPLFLAGLMLFWLLPPAALALAAAGLLPGALLAPATLATGFQVLFWSLVSAGMRIPPWYGLFFPVGALLALFIILRSTIRGARKVEWKDRVYEGVEG